MSAEHVKQMIDSGIEPFGVEYYPVKKTSSHEQDGLRTVLKINSVDLGTLYPQQYRVVTNRNAQCIRLASFCYKKVSETLDAMIFSGRLHGFVSIYAPAKMLMRGELEKLLSSEKSADKLYLSNLCFEFSSDILLGDSAETAQRLNALKAYGVKLMISEFGDEFCPVLRLKALPFDYVVLDSSLSFPDRMTDQNVASLIGLISGLGMNAMLENTDSAELIETAALSGCSYYCSGKPLSDKEVTG